MYDIVAFLQRQRGPCGARSSKDSEDSEERCSGAVFRRAAPAHATLQCALLRIRGQSAARRTSLVPCAGTDLALRAAGTDDVRMPHS